MLTAMLLALSLAATSPAWSASDAPEVAQEAAEEAEEAEEAPLAVWSAPVGEVRRDREALAELVDLPEGSDEVAWVRQALPRAGGALPATEANALSAWVAFEGRSLPASWGSPTEPPGGRVVFDGVLARQLLPAAVLSGAEDQGTRLGFAVDGTLSAPPVGQRGVVVSTAHWMAGRGLLLQLVGVPARPTEPAEGP